METKPLLYGLIGFFMGGLLVATAATTFDKPSTQTNSASNDHANVMTMDAMTTTLQSKRGEDYDRAFISYMIEHHQAAVDMARLSNQRASHSEIKQLSSNIIAAQQTEIRQMQQWQQEWGYETAENHSGMGH
jgi:uncharacterized protein (DUF305 family)